MTGSYFPRYPWLKNKNIAIFIPVSGKRDILLLQSFGGGVVSEMRNIVAIILAFSLLLKKRVNNALALQSWCFIFVQYIKIHIYSHLCLAVEISKLESQLPTLVFIKQSKWQFRKNLSVLELTWPYFYSNSLKESLH